MFKHCKIRKELLEQKRFGSGTSHVFQDYNKLEMMTCIYYKTVIIYVAYLK